MEFEQIESAPILPGRHENLDAMRRGWLLWPTADIHQPRAITTRRAIKWTILSILIALLVIGVPVFLAKSAAKHKQPPSPLDNYTVALHKALIFFNAHKCEVSHEHYSW